MTGYSGYSKSNNAVRAENDSLHPANFWAKRIGRGVKAADVKASMRYAEWHHTSKKYNVTYYYACPSLSELKAIIQAARDRRNSKWEITCKCGRVSSEKFGTKTHCYGCGESF